MKVEESILAGDFHSNGHSVGIGTAGGNLLVYDLRHEASRVLFSGH